MKKSAKLREAVENVSVAKAKMVLKIYYIDRVLCNVWLRKYPDLRQEYEKTVLQGKAKNVYKEAESCSYLLSLAENFSLLVASRLESMLPFTVI